MELLLPTKFLITDKRNKEKKNKKKPVFTLAQVRMCDGNDAIKSSHTKAQEKQRKEKLCSYKKYHYTEGIL